jgi:hypothetical protein
MQMTAGLLLMALVFGGQQAAPKDDPWASYRFLIGTWTGEGSGQPGNTTGTATFKLDLDGRILVRTSSTVVPPRGQQAGYTHEDRLVVFRDAPGQPARAIYWDNEDHTIEYDVSVSPDGKIVTFVSKPVPSVPRFRLVYTRLAADSVDVKFEMAPPGNPDAFKVYTEGVTKRATITK